MSYIELKVTGMSCEACVSHVRRALENVAGVHSAKVDLEDQIARVEGEGLFTAPLIAAIEEEGYEAAPIEQQSSRATLPFVTAGCSCCSSNDDQK